MKNISRYGLKYAHVPSFIKICSHVLTVEQTDDRRQTTFFRTHMYAAVYTLIFDLLIKLNY